MCCNRNLRENYGQLRIFLDVLNWNEALIFPCIPCINTVVASWSRRRTNI